MRVHKRKKNSRIRGARTVGWGFRQKHKGHGNKGGFGKAGTGKRADHKKQSAEQAVKGKYFGKRGDTSRGTKRIKYDKINLCDVKANYSGAKDDRRSTIEKTTGLLKISLPKHKILGKGDGFKAEIVALGASKMAIEKMEKAGGKIVLPVVKDGVKQYAEKKEKDEGKEEKGSGVRDQGSGDGSVEEE